MRITAAVAEQLRLLHDDPDRGDDFAAALTRLGRDIAGAVPSCLSVTITLPGLGDQISVSTPAPPAPVLASLAVPLSAGPGGQLLLRAAEVGAFLLLAEDLNGLLGPGRPPVEVDRHLTGSAPAGGGASLAELSIVDRAVGVLVDQGWPPEAARPELRRRAEEAGTSVAAVSRELLASVRGDPGPG